jgi:hypothetical protein
MTAALFARKATGGVVARDGFGHQDEYLLLQLPRLLSESAFSFVVSEVLGDIEVRYFRPGGGTCCISYELKKNTLSKDDFWSEIADFAAQHQQSPEEYVRFVLVCGGFHAEIKPLLTSLERFRGTGQSLNQDSPVKADAEAELIQRVVDLGQSPSIARFVLSRVRFETYAEGQGKHAFSSLLAQHVPFLASVRGNQMKAIQDRFDELCSGSYKGLVSRRTLEEAVSSCLDDDQRKPWLATATPLAFLPDAGRLEELHVDLNRFNGPTRALATSGDWRALLAQVEELATFITATRLRSTVELSAKQRMSAACLLGFVFSATKGFRLRMAHNDDVFDTADHSKSSAPFFLTPSEASATGSDGVVSIGFPTDNRIDVAVAAEALGLADMPRAYLQSSLVIADVAQLNTAVAEAKTEMLRFRASYGLKKLHLFIKAPSIFAMALGHRLNGIGPVQLYDWADGQYNATAELS